MSDADTWDEYYDHPGPGDPGYFKTRQAGRKMGEANRKLDHAVREVLKRTSPDVTTETVVRLASADLGRPIRESDIENSIKRVTLAESAP